MEPKETSTEELVKALPHLKGLVEVSRKEYGIMIGPLESTTGGCTVHNSPDGDRERIYSVQLKVWTNRYPEWANTKIGYQVVAATATRYPPSVMERYFVHPALIEMLIVF